MKLVGSFILLASSMSISACGFADWNGRTSGVVADDPNAAEAVVDVTYLAYQEHRDCWAIHTVTRPAAIWQSWADSNCLESIEMQRVYWIGDEDGHCGQFEQTLEHGRCEVSDPGWVSTCDMDKHACCEWAELGDSGIGRRVPMCYPNAYYEPSP